MLTNRAALLRLALCFEVSAAGLADKFNPQGLDDVFAIGESAEHHDPWTEGTELRLQRPWLSLASHSIGELTRSQRVHPSKLNLASKFNFKIQISLQTGQAEDY